MPDIPEEYYYSTLSAEEIEDRLLHMVPYNKNISLSAEEKALFRANIDAGQTNAGFIVLGYFETIEDMQESLTQIPKVGDAYGIAKHESGTESLYDIYVYDGYHKIWVNNGPLDMGNAVIADDEVSSTKAWSSSKVNTALAAKMNAIAVDTAPTENSSNLVTSSGVYHALADKPIYSQLLQITPGTTHAITVADIVKTLMDSYDANASSLTTTFTLAQSDSANFPIGSEIAIFNGYSGTMLLTISGLRLFSAENGIINASTTNKSILIPKYGLIAIKKMEQNSTAVGDAWLLTGNAEVQS